MEQHGQQGGMGRAVRVQAAEAGCRQAKQWGSTGRAQAGHGLVQTALSSTTVLGAAGSGHGQGWAARTGSALPGAAVWFSPVWRGMLPRRGGRALCYASLQ